MSRYFAILDASESGDGDYVEVCDTLEEAIEWRKSYDLPGSVAVDVDTFYAQRTQIAALTTALRNIVNGDYNNAREIHAVERYAREELAALLAATPGNGAGPQAAETGEGR